MFDGLTSKEKMARPKRFELLTPRFVVWCSIQLSYGRVLRIAREVFQGGQIRQERAFSYRLRCALASLPMFVRGLIAPTTSSPAGLTTVSRIYPTCVLKIPEIG